MHDASTSVSTTLPPPPSMERLERGSARGLALTTSVLLEGIALILVLYGWEVPGPAKNPLPIGVRIPLAAERPNFEASMLPMGKVGGRSGGTGSRSVEQEAAPLASFNLNVEPDLMPIHADEGAPLAKVALELPVATAGNGLPAGVGQGYGSGQGNGTGSGATLPRLVHYIRPRYRGLQGFRAVEGQVRLSMLVDGEGCPRNVKAEGEYAVLIRAAVRAVNQWRFESPLKCGLRVPFKISVLVDFKEEAVSISG